MSSTYTEEIKMFIQPLVGWVKSLAEQFQKPQTYGSELEAYIISNDPQTAYDVDRLTREFDQKNHGGFYAS
jgi:hypothetical protein